MYKKMTMRKLLVLLLAIPMFSCVRDTDVLGAPRAIPVKPSIEKLGKHVDSSKSIAVDLKSQAEKADKEGLKAGSTETAKLLKDVDNLLSELDSAREEVIVVKERSNALEIERDAYYKSASNNLKEIDHLKQDVAVLQDRRKFWLLWALGSSSVLLVIVLLKLARLYGYSLNPASYFTR